MKQEKVDTLISELKMSDDLLVLKAIKKIRKSGSEKLIQPLVELLHDTDSDTVKQEIIQLFYDLKDSKSIPVLLDALDSEKGIPNRAILMSVFWQAGMNPSEEVDVFVRIAIEGDYMQALEALTVIENLEGPFKEETILESLLNLKSYFSNEKDDPKRPLILTIAEILNLVDKHL
jgi:HEAT repeat protein